MRASFNFKLFLFSLLTLCICLFGLQSFAATEDKALLVTVDQRVELMSVVFRLAGNPEYSQGRVKSYVEDVESHFGKWREHEVVEMARNLRKTRGVSYDAVMHYAIHLNNDLEPVIPFSPKTLDSRWSLKDACAFHEKLISFAKDTEFKKFFKSHRPLYAKAVSRMEDVAWKNGHFDWFDQFFGARPGAHFSVVLAMLNGGCCYGPRILSDKNREDLYCILGVWSTDSKGDPQFDKSMLPTVVHEFCHSYVNPIVNKNESHLRKSGEQIYPCVASKMARQAYGNWVTMMYESLVRASVVRYLLAHEGEQAAKQETIHQEDKHFLWTSELVDLLGEYEADREKYPDFESFFPRVVHFFNDYAPQFVQKMKEQLENTPKVISMTPKNGDKNVDPGLEAIIVTFDRPMGGKYSFVGGGPHFPEGIAKPKYDSDQKTITLKVKLKPNWKYDFWLNRGKYNSFKSKDGVPLEPVHVKFSTNGPDPEMDEQRIKDAPKIISMTPKNGDKNVDPGLEAIIVTFDRPMGGDYSFVRGVGGRPHFPEVIAKSKFDSDHKTFTLKVKLKPNWKYDFWLNGEWKGEMYDSFKSKDGVPLEPVHVKFSTGSYSVE